MVITDKLLDNVDEWAKDAVKWALDNGILYGDENGDLQLSQNCTRQEVLVFINRFAKKLGVI